ncbi:MAG: hypothetical protein OSB05_05770 [Akkermansiaceae bacterium]|nr:hypothetical protein [Akkermansiaceae bacterium]
MKYLNSFLLSCVAACSCHAELVAHWPLDSDALDATGNAHNGTVVDGTVNFGQPGANANTGSAAAFPDTGHIDVPFDAALNGESFTVALWANAASTGGFSSPLTSRDDVAGPLTHGFIIYNNNAGVWDFWTGDSDAGWDSLAGSPVTTDTWTHVAITYDAPTDTKTLWIDGVVSATDNIPQSGPTQYAPNGTIEMENLHIGAGQDDGLNFYFDGLIDDVGIWNEALDQTVLQSIMANGVVSGLSDPALSVPNPIDLVLNGGIQVIEIPINNPGQTQTLTVSAATFNGDPNFSVTTLPGPVTPGSSGNLVVTFDPAGNNGAFEADLKITSNDSLTPVRTTTLRGAIHDPMLVSDATVDLGENTTGTITLTNNGATRSLQVSGITITGNSDNFEITSIPSTIAANGGTDDIEISFDSLGEQGNFSVTLTFNTDDPINPAFIVIVTATVPFSDTLVAWWPLDVDGTDASGNGFDGVVEGSLVASPGANGATGGSLEFDGFSSRIDVPFDQALNPQDFTVTLWANASTTSGFASPITSRDDVGGGTSTHGYILYNDNGGNWNFWTGDGNPGWDTLTGESVTTDTWTHIAMTFDSVTQTKSIWINGTLAASDVAAAQYSLNGTVEMEPLHIGAGQDDGLNFWFSGKIDDVGLFRVALSPDNINSIMTDGVGGFTGSSRALEITDIDLGPNPGEVTITFNSVNGAAYIIERSTNLAPDSWDELTDNHASEGETTSFTDLDVPVGTTKLFYRVIRP